MGLGLGTNETLTGKVLANNGVNLAVTARRKDLLEDLAGEIQKENSVKILPLELDVTDAESVRKTVQQATEQLGDINILINNAGNI